MDDLSRVHNLSSFSWESLDSFLSKEASRSSTDDAISGKDFSRLQLLASNLLQM